MHLRPLLLAPLLFLLAACGGPSGGGPAASSPFSTAAEGPAPSGEAASAASPDNDLLRVGDILTIRLSGVPADDAGVYDVKIGDQGEISMPLLSGTFRAAGKTTSQLKDEIEGAYKSRGIYSTPNITIVPQLRYVNVSGEVRSPQRIPFTNDLSVLKALAACGGFTDYASKHHVKLLRGNRATDFDAVAAMQNPSLDLPLVAGDQVQVPRSIF